MRNEPAELATQCGAKFSNRLNIGMKKDLELIAEAYVQILNENQNAFDAAADKEYIAKDNAKEFKFYQTIGIGENIDVKKYLNMVQKAPVRKFSVDELLQIRPELKTIIKGNTVEQKLLSFKRHYAQEKREPYGELSGNLELGDVEYLNRLINAMKNNEVKQPPILLDIGNHYLIAGGRTRIAIAVCLNMPIKCKVVDVEVTDKDKAKQGLKDYFDIAFNGR